MKNYFGKLGVAKVPKESFEMKVPKSGYYNTMLPTNMVEMYNNQMKMDSKVMIKGKPRSKN